MFHWMVLPGWLPPEVYSLGIAATPEAYHVYDEATRSVELREPEQVGSRSSLRGGRGRAASGLRPAAAQQAAAGCRAGGWLAAEPSGAVAALPLG